MAVFRVIAPFSLVEIYQRFRGLCCLHHQGDERLIALIALMMEAARPLKRWQTSTRLRGATTQKTAIFIFTAVRTSNPTYERILTNIFCYQRLEDKPYPQPYSDIW
jgi:hypothetical protein